ncbi:MAG: pilus assembly protein N-terminal domain-containing protein [Pseudomonadota bacterium]
MLQKVSALVGGLAIAGMIALAPLTGAHAEGVPYQDFYVPYDQAKLMRLEQDVADVIVGNDTVASVQVNNRRLLIITGKTFGTTNMILLNRDGDVITHRRLVVRTNDQQVVNVTGGTERRSFACAPTCQPILKVGDNEEFFNSVKKAASAKEGGTTE